ncbi:hypothetical protein G6F59_017793 [Rhizopus arrhizus]|nr:hypothetical protein G6F59_017793 [Rhizopus arrhizus]
MRSIFRPSATVGDWPSAQPTPLGTCIGGIRKFFGAGSGGFAPDWSVGWYSALPAQADRVTASARAAMMGRMCLAMTASLQHRRLQ